jgi:hypothetical protein
LRRRLFSAGFLTDKVTRLGLSGQYLRGETQDDGSRAQYGGLLLDVEVFGSVSVGFLGQLDFAHGGDPGGGIVLRLDLSELEELGIPVPGIGT